MSIDSFLGALPKNHHNDKLRKIGTDAVAAILLKCEKESRLNGDWYQWFLEFLLRKGPNFPAGMISVITFNYDRSLECYLWRCFRKTFGLTGTEARAMVEKIEFIHVNGDLGTLDFKDRTMGAQPTNPDAIPYGAVHGMFTSGMKLRIASEPPPELRRRVSQLLSLSERILFLGFGFWGENMNVLHTPPSTKITTPEMIETEEVSSWFRKKVFASGYGLWRSIQIEIDARVGFVDRGSGHVEPLIKWGESKQDLFQFVTHFDLKEKYNLPRTAYRA